MHIGQFAMLYGISLVLFTLFDLLWLGVVAQNFYRNHIGHLMGDTIVWLAACAFYLLFIAGLTYFVTYPAVLNGQMLHTLLIGAFFGLIAYATYDLTNAATLKSWSISLTLVDMAWGAFLSGVVAAATVFIYKLFV